MSAMEAFHSTWSQAKDTFGSGTPTDGSDFDNSAKLRELQSTVAAAKPDDRWQGPAADAYAAKNEKHAITYGKLADLDERMAAEVGKTPGIVTAGRQNLDQLQDWARSAAASVPSGQNADTMKMIIASKGLSQISEILQQSNDEMTTVGDRIRDLGKEYDEISGNKQSASPQAKHDDFDLDVQFAKTTDAPASSPSAVIGEDSYMVCDEDLTGGGTHIIGEDSCWC